MKKFNLFSLVLMAGMLLFVGGCQRDEELFAKVDNEKSTSLVLDSMMLKRFMIPGEEYFIKGGRSGEDMASYDTLNKICDLILRQDSTNHFLASFVRKFGFPVWLKSFEVNENRGTAKIISIPFVKDSVVTGVLQYHSSFGGNGLVFFSKEHIYSLIQTNLNVDKNLELVGVYNYIISQVKCLNKVDQAIVTWLEINIGGNIHDIGKNGSRYEKCITYCGTITYIYDNSNNGGGIVTATGDGCVTICYQVTPPIHSSNTDINGFSNGSFEWWKVLNNNFTGSGSSSGDGGTNNNNDQLQKEEEERKKRELEACVNAQSDAATEALLNEAVEDLIFPCENFIGTRLKKAAIKAEIKQKWCEDQSDNPGILQPDGTRVKPKMTAADIEDALEDALEEEDYIDDSQINGANCPCVNAIWKQIKAAAISSNFANSECKVLEILSDFLEGPLQAEIGVSSLNLPNNTNAVTFPNTTNVGNGNELLLLNSRIEINPSLCTNTIDKDPLEIAGMILHELIHARIFESLYNRGFNLNSIANQKYDRLWELFVQSNYPDIQPVGNEQHEFMAQVYVNDLAQALHDLNGGVGEPSDYLLIAWQGLLGAYPEETRHLYDFLPNIEELQTNFNNNVKGQGDLQFNGCN